MRIALIDPFFEDSHKTWAEGYQQHSSHEIDIYSGSARNWKWKMTGGTIPIAKKLQNAENIYDIIIASDMLNIPLFKSLLPVRMQCLPFILYFHENQITYPWSSTDPDVSEERDHHYGFVNYCSALVASKIFFNSAYHQKSFLNSLPGFIRQFPNASLSQSINEIINKSAVLPIGLDLPPRIPSDEDVPVFIWNHRWEYDKNPEGFFKILLELKNRGLQFKLIIAGKAYSNTPDIFQEIQSVLTDEIIHFGYVESKAAYFKLLKKANILLVTSFQDFFGISIVEAIASGCYPILPDRLSYREHIDASLADNVFYSTESECMELIVNVVSNNKYQNCREFDSHIRKYDWKNMIDKYDCEFEKVSQTPIL